MIWDEAYGVPLFQTVGVDAYSDRVTGVKSSPSQTRCLVELWEWQVK